MIEASAKRMEALGRLEVATERLKAATKDLRKGEVSADTAVELGLAFHELRLVARLVDIQWPFPPDVTHATPPAAPEDEPIEGQYQLLGPAGEDAVQEEPIIDD